MIETPKVLLPIWLLPEKYSSRQKQSKRTHQEVNPMTSKRQSLGKGLDALLGIEEGDDNFLSETLSPEAASQLTADGVLQQLPVEFLQRGTVPAAPRSKP
jgi:hypothetical protein